MSQTKKKKIPVRKKATDPKLEMLGNRIKELRIKKGYTNYEYFAYESGIPRAQYGRYEKGEDLRFSSLIKVLNGLDITFKEFFNEGFD